MYKCSFCTREFKNAGSKVSHEKFCKSDPNFQASTFTCEFCGKEFIGISGINNHSKFCKHNPNKAVRKEYKTAKIDNNLKNCQYCGKVCKNSNSHTQHELRCSKNPNRLPINDFSQLYKGYPDEVKQRMKWNAGETKETNLSVRAYAEKLTGKPGTMRGKTFKMPESAKDKQSETRRIRIAEGKITPVTCHRYTNSYIQYRDGKKKFLRSSYELIVAIFLDFCGVNFEYESVRAPYYDSNGKLHSFIGDFSVGDVVLEIKGDYDAQKLAEEEHAFKKLGYQLRVIYEDEVFHIRDLLQNFFDIKALLKEVKELSDDKNYYIYELKF